MTDSEDIIKFIQHAEALKRVFRSGWSIAGVNNMRFESVAEHSYGTVVISAAISRYLESQNVPVDFEKLLIMAAIHDLPESLTSDIPRAPSFADTALLADMKQKIESAAIREIVTHPVSDSDWILGIWEEYTNGTTLEARIVKGADIIDMLMHALNLEDSGISPEILHQFFSNSRKEVESLDVEIISSIFTALLRRHERNSEY